MREFGLRHQKQSVLCNLKLVAGFSFGCGRPHGCKPGSPESSTVTIVHAAFKARPNATHRIDTSHLFPSASAQEINK